MAHVGGDLALLRRAASSDAVTEWFADESNDEKRQAAFDELIIAAASLTNEEFYIGITGSLNEYAIDLTMHFEAFTPYGRMAANEPIDAWFFDLLESDNDFLFNIDVDRIAHRWRIWINHKVFHEGQTVGVLCTSFRIDEMLNNMFGQYDKDFIRGYVIDNMGYIHIGSETLEHFMHWEEELIHISSLNVELGEFVADFANRSERFFTVESQPEVIRLSGRSYDFAVVAPIANSDWMVVTMYSSNALFGTRELLPFAVAIIAAIILYMLIITATTRHYVLKPLARLTTSISNTELEAELYGIERNDEIGVLARNIYQAQESLRHREMERRRIEIAEESNRAKSRFLARMSHEIRTPITAVLGISEIELQNPDLIPRMEESFAKIHSSANLLLGIVNDVLDLSKIEAGKMELHQEEYELASMISDVTQLHPNYLNSKDIEFRLTVDENLPTHLFGDLLRIEQIMTNLLSNAFKYTDAGSVELSWRCSEYEDKDGYVKLQIAVSDTGLGMTNEQLNVLKNGEYTRFHESENRVISGTGLGVPIVYNLLNLMDAHIEIESEVGKGTNIVVSIPQKLSTKTEVMGREIANRLQQFEENVRSARKKFTFTPEPMPYGSVLVVDDVEANLYVTRGLLAFYALKVETCTNGHDAIEKIKQGNIYNLIFMDHMMPGLNGTETMQRIRGLGYKQPIVALTANALIGQAEEFIKNGFDGFISKPIQTKHLNAILIKHIRDKQPKEVIEAALESHKARGTNSSEDIDDFQNNPELVEKLRADFARRYKNAFAEITQAINNGDFKHARLLAHTLKSSAALIHAPALSKSAEHLEHKLTTGKMPIVVNLSSLEEELKRVLEDIGEPEPTLPSVTSFNKDAAFALFDKLEPLLATKNSRCMDLLDELRQIPETAALCRLIEDFDFKIAHNVLIALKSALAG